MGGADKKQWEFTLITGSISVFCPLKDSPLQQGFLSTSRRQEWVDFY